MDMRIEILNKEERKLGTYDCFDVNTVEDALKRAINSCLDFGDYNERAEEWAEIRVTIFRSTISDI